MLLRDDDPPERRLDKLTRINAALMERMARLEDERGSGWSMFQAAVALEAEVGARTRELEQTLTHLSARNSELAVARAAAEEANRSKTRFLRAAGHDLLQPLAAARLFLDALADTPLDPLQSELTGRLAAAFESVEQLMHAVIDISRLDSQRIEFDRKPVDMAALFRRLAVEYAPLAAARGLRLDFAPTSAVVDSDPTFLRRIAQNLLSNAIKYTDRGRVLVGVRHGGGVARLEVHDTGIGISPADRGRIFDEFQRVDRQGGPAGMGLGLAIVRRACVKLKHPLTLESMPGRGTVFRVTLPLVSNGTGGGAPGVMAPAPGPAPGGDLLGRRKVMVIENDPSMRRGLALTLTGLGMVVCSFPGTAEAMAAIERDTAPDVILADYNLDGGDTGLIAVAAVREQAARAIPALLITARREPEIARTCAEAGIRLLEKPLTAAELGGALESLLGQADGNARDCGHGGTPGLDPAVRSGFPSRDK